MRVPEASASAHGFTCSVCGSWVGFGQYHACGGSPNQTPPPTIPTITMTPDPTQLRIAMALERIAAALEKSVPDDR